MSRKSKIEITCDRCSRIITGNLGELQIVFVEPGEQDNPTNHTAYDLCEGCLGRVYELLHRNERE